jgi:hypothetical protein
MVLGLVHPVQAFALGETLTAGVEESGDAAHALEPGSADQGGDRAGPHGKTRILTELDDAPDPRTHPP